MYKIIFFSIFAVLGITCFSIHATTSWMDEAGHMHEPFFYLVLVGYPLVVIGLLGLIATCIYALWHRLYSTHSHGV